MGLKRPKVREDQARNDRGNGQGQIHKGVEDLIAEEAVARQAPGGEQAEDGVHGHGNEHRDQR